MGRLIGLLALLNGVVLAAGLSLEQVRGQPGALLGFNADKVRLLGRAERPQAAQAKAAEAEAPAPRAAESVAEAARPKPRCLAWHRLDEGLLVEIEAHLEDAGIADYDIHLQKRLGWWVYLPPFADPEAMQAAIDTARQKGVRDIASVRGGGMENAVSLGAFTTLAKARARMEKLHALGMRGLRMGPRPKSGGARLVIADSVAEARLAGLGEGWGKGRTPMACAGN